MGAKRGEARRQAPAAQARAEPGAAERPRGNGAPSGRPSVPTWAGLLPAVALGALVYARTLTFGFSFLDDAFLADKDSLGNLGGVGKAFESVYVLGTYYRPLVMASYILDAKWTGAEAFGYHLTNVLLHLIAIVLVYVLLIRLRFQRPISAFATSIFAIHPALVETVAWIPGRTDSLFVAFALGAWIFLALDIERPSPLLPLGHIACLLGALFTKETALVLPVVYAAYLRSIGSTSDWLRSKRIWPWWLLGIAGYAAVRVAVGAPAEVTGATAGALLAHIPVLFSCLGKLCFPFQLSPLATAHDTPIWPGLIAAAGIAGAIVLLRPLRRGALLLAASTFLLPLLPTLFVAERLTLENRLYMPAVGLCILIAELASAWSPSGRPLLAAMGGFVLLSFFPVTWTYASAFRNRETVAKSAVDASPSSALAHLQRGDGYYTIQHDLNQAETEYRRAIEIDPRERVVHNNLAVVLMAIGRLPEAEVELKKELEINPQYAPAHYNLGIVLRQTGRAEDAATEWERTLQSDPNHINAMGELFVYYSARGEQAKAAYYRDQIAERGMRFVSPP